MADLQALALDEVLDSREKIWSGYECSVHRGCCRNALFSEWLAALRWLQESIWISEQNRLSGHRHRLTKQILVNIHLELPQLVDIDRFIIFSFCFADQSPFLRFEDYIEL